MEEILSQAFSTGDLKIIAAAVIVYCVVYFQRKKTSEKRNTDHDDLQTRITLLEADNKMLHSQLDTIGEKLDKITDLLTNIRIELSNKKDRE